MKNIKWLAGILFIVGILDFFLWNRDNPNGFWWTGFMCLASIITASSLTAVFEKGWVRIFRITSVIGMIMNTAVMTANGGRMPVICYRSKEVVTGLWKAASQYDKLPWLCDRFSLLQGTLSIGDFVLIGSILLILFWPKEKA